MREFKKLMLLGWVGAAVIALTGCSSTLGPSDERAEGQRANDSRITTHVKDRLAREPVFKFNEVDVKTYDSVVQLSGFVNTEEQKSRAGELAQQVAGVSRVVNGLTIKQPQTASPTGRPWQAPIINNPADQATMNSTTNQASGTAWPPPQNSNPGQNQNQ